MRLTLEEQEGLKMLAAQDAIHNGSQERRVLAQLTKEYERAKKRNKVDEFKKVVNRNLF